MRHKISSINLPNVCMLREFRVAFLGVIVCVLCVTNFLNSKSGIYQQKIWTKSTLKTKIVEKYCGSFRPNVIKNIENFKKYHEKTLQNLKIWRKSENLIANPRSEILDLKIETPNRNSKPPKVENCFKNVWKQISKMFWNIYISYSFL